MNIKQHKFVTEYLRWGDQVIAYKNAYNATSNYKTLESSANRLLRSSEVAQTIREAQARIRETVEKEVAEQLKGNLLTIQHKRELLYEIATGQLSVEQTYKGKDCNVCSQYIRPTINQMLKAIDLDNKLAGHYTHQHKPTNHVTASKNDEVASRQSGKPKQQGSQQSTTKNYPPRRGVGVGSLASETKHGLSQHPDSYRDITNQCHTELDSASHVRSRKESKPEKSQQNTTNERLYVSTKPLESRKELSEIAVKPIRARAAEVLLE